MGVVYLANDTVLRREVALKLLVKGHDDDSPAERQRFLREARAAARLLHPNVVQIFQVGETNEFRYIAMEYVPGLTTLALAKRRGGRLPVQLCVAKMREAADALALAASLGICHQDIKPANLLLTASGALKITDFGLAAHVEGSESIGAATASHVQGTPYYMSPEQWRSESITPATDVYSLGGTFFRLITGEPPFGRRDLVGCLSGHCNEAPRDPRSLMPELDPRLAALLLQCLAKRPHDRPRAEELIVTLAELLVEQEGPSLARPALALGTTPTVSTHYDEVATSGIEEAPLDQAHDAVGEGTGDITLPKYSRRASVVTNLPRDEEDSLQSYHSAFRLTGYPFSEIRQPESFWDDGPYHWALRTLASQLGRGSRLSMLLGPSGSGRTFLCDMLAARAPLLHIFRVEPQFSFGERMIVSLCRQHGIDVDPSASSADLMTNFLAHALSGASSDDRAAIVIDSLDEDAMGSLEAQAELIDELRRFETGAAPRRLSALVVGPMDIDYQLATAGLTTLRPDAPPVLLEPMTQQEMVAYLDFRLRTLGGLQRSLHLEPATLQLLHARSGGIPRLVNVYCHNALTIAALLGSRDLAFEHLRLGLKSKTYLTAKAARALLAQLGAK